MVATSPCHLVVSESYGIQYRVAPFYYGATVDTVSIEVIGQFNQFYRSFTDIQKDLPIWSTIDQSGSPWTFVTQFASGKTDYIPLTRDVVLYNDFLVRHTYTVCECVCRHQQIAAKSPTGPPQDLQITPYAVSRLRSYDPDWRETTPELNYELEPEMASFPQYTYNKTQVVSVAGINVAIQALGGNKNRMTVILSTANGGAFAFHDTQIPGLGRYIATMNGPSTMVLAYRDYGPIIRGEIWCSSSVGATVNVTEVIEIPQPGTV